MNILTFDVEEWYHIKFENSFLDNSKLINSLEKRLDYNVKTILDMLDFHEQKASFFCLGEVAKFSPGVIKCIAERGHDIGCHSHNHKLASTMSEEEFNNDLKLALDSIESEIGEKVKIYRAPAFSVTQDNLWVLDALLDQGIEVDASIFSASRDFGGNSDIEITRPVKIITPLGNSIKEFPMSVYAVFGQKLVLTGGGYFRLWPYPVIKKIISKSKYTMTYFHPRDFDYNQPILEGLSLKRKFKSYYGIRGALGKLDAMLNDFEFLPISEADKLIDWSYLTKE